MSTTLQDLVKQRADLDAQIAAAKAADFHTAVQHAAHLFGEAGVPLDEAAAALLTLHNQSARPPAARQGRAEVPPPPHRRDVDGPGQATEVVCCGRAERN